MLQALSQKPKPFAWFFVLVMYVQLAVPLVTKGAAPVVTYKASLPAKSINTLLKPQSGHAPLLPVKRPNEIRVPHTERVTEGPGQPEMAAFTSVNSSNMVDLFSGDFSYNIPLLDVGGYPVNIGYRSGASMDEEASWVGLGWNINPGTISRNLRGIPDDFNGNDSIKKVSSIKENKTIGVTGAMNAEIVGFPIGLGASLGLFYNNYKGWGLETGLNASINASLGAKGENSGGTDDSKPPSTDTTSGTASLGLSLKNNSQEGLSISPSFSVAVKQEGSKETTTTSVGVSLPYNSRVGLKGLQLSSGLRQEKTNALNQKSDRSASMSSFISFATPSFTPTITMPFTSTQFSLTFKVGAEFSSFRPDFSISGYVSSQKIAPRDTLLALPAYGYLHYQEGAKNRAALLDFNTEKELIYRADPPTPHIALPIYTYDAFSITGEGTGGMFRAYRGDIGFVHDHSIRTKDASNALSLDLGLGNIVHGGVDLNVNRAYTQNGPWLASNDIQHAIDFKSDNRDFEASYFRNPGEKSVNSKSFYEALGGDDVLSVNLFQSSRSSSTIQATSSMRRIQSDGKEVIMDMKPQDGFRKERDKRTQVISYLNAKEASIAGLTRYIESYTPNVFLSEPCEVTEDDLEDTPPHGLIAKYYNAQYQRGPAIVTQTVDSLNANYYKNGPLSNIRRDDFSVSWDGRFKAPETGRYTLRLFADDHSDIYFNDSLVISSAWGKGPIEKPINLEAGVFYKIRAQLTEYGGGSFINLQWKLPSASGYSSIPPAAFYLPLVKDSFIVQNVRKEKRQNTFRKSNHISEITVLNNDGRRYVYGIPVYNLKQREATFAVDHEKGDRLTGLAKFTPWENNSTRNKSGRDNYYNSEEMPAYAHSFLLTGIVSPDYVDLTGNGISDDDAGDGVKFNYSRICGINNPFKWRVPFTDTSVTYNEGFKTDNNDDKGNYVYGEKELWFLHSIVSKSMVATFVLDNGQRLDMNEMDESGRKIASPNSRRLKEINLYNKADFNTNSHPRPIKTVHFEYSYELCKGINKPLNDSGKLTLKKIWFTYNGNNKGKQNPYVFNYNAKNPSYNIKSYDRWGNYKDPLQNPGSVPANIIDNAEYPYALQDSSLAAANAAAWSLDSINLPSGGAIKVDFESDDYAYVQNKRAMQLFKIKGFGQDSIMPSTNLNKLYTQQDNLYVYVTVPTPVTNKTDAYYKYLVDIKKLYFKLFVKMRSDLNGSGSEYVPCYADLANAGSFGIVNATTLWIKLDGISLKGDTKGNYSPLAKAAIQFIRLNLPSKAYPNSEIGDDLNIANVVKSMAAMGDTYINAFSSFDNTARGRMDGSEVELNRTYIRLNNPDLKKYGGGYRVKRIMIYDNWDKMTQQKASVYGQEYTYTTETEINGVRKNISSGVATFEPGIGGEENPFRIPIEVVEKIAPLGPVTMGYSEEPLGESLFPSPSVGYSNVRVRSLNTKNKRSANGFEETSFYTAYDFPTIVSRSVLDPNSKKIYKPTLLNLIRINKKSAVALSQGFRIELNDMHGKMRRQATYAETNSVDPIKSTENVYKMQSRLRSVNRLSNDAVVMKPDGSIDTAAIIGKDVELMVNMREQLSVTNGYNVNINSDMFMAGISPFMLPSLLNLAQREENLYRSVAVLKVVNRFGILDSVIQWDKGSKISTKDMMYDSETGDAILTRTQNEFEDPIYNFNYPAHWAYDGMGLAYKNINVQLFKVDIRDGKITGGLTVPDTVYFAGGDEILVAGKNQTGTSGGCDIPFAAFPNYTKIWAIDSSAIKGGKKQIYFINKNGTPYNGFDVSLKIIRSGRRNMSASVGSVTTMVNPLTKNEVNNTYKLAFDSTTRVINASAGSFSQFWKVPDLKKTVRQPFTSIGACPAGYTYSTALQTCIKDTSLIIKDTLKVCLNHVIHQSFSACGSYIYSSFAVDNSSFFRSRIDSTFFWNSEFIGPMECNYTPATQRGDIYLRSGNTTDDFGVIPGEDTIPLEPQYATIPNVGPMNRAGVWFCDSSSIPDGTWKGFTVALKIPHAGYYYLGEGADDFIRITIDSVVVRQDGTSATNTENYHLWHILPYYLTKGVHLFKVEARNNSGIRGFGFEIYDNTDAQIRSATSYAGLNLIFSTKDIGLSTFASSYGCPVNFNPVTDSSGNQVCRRTIAPAIDTGFSLSCRSIVTDTLLNPYVTGILGNWRGNRSYVYYNNRTEADPGMLTNIRRDGTFKTFTPYHNFADQRLVATSDTINWVWNSEIVNVNRKGLEIENKDPLGRYNSGLYGYGETMPTAVIQNGRHRESAFEGFEDYDYSTQKCDTCPSARHADFSNYKSKFSTLYKHTGKSSIRLSGSGEKIALAFRTAAPGEDTVRSSLSFVTKTDACVAAGLKSVQTPASILLPAFSPLRSKRMLISAWVKEELPCTGTSYSNNHIRVFFGGLNDSLFSPAGPIIEGWQRYEGVFDIADTTTSVGISLEPVGSAVVYFDDIRIHPFNANMKSYVYNPTDLRLMAELDENNYASFYEYDDDGTLIRVKKETQRGIKTIKETRSALIKQ